MGRSFAQDFGSNVMGLWPGCIEGGTDFSCGIHFSIQGIFLTYAQDYRLGLSDLDDKINIKIFDLKISEMFMRYFRDEILKRSTLFCF